MEALFTSLGITFEYFFDNLIEENDLIIFICTSSILKRLLSR